ncbi:MAG: hypothetical protein JXR91_02430 [Deltaproteobacteria bacterium]|nr:hypothetical protein [Deltaproteobacteria bacterium]
MESSESEYSKINDERLVSFIELTSLAKQKQLEIESAFKWLNSLSPQMDLEIHRTVLSVSLEKIKRDIKEHTDLKFKLTNMTNNIEDIRDILLNECVPSKNVDTESFYTEPVNIESNLDTEINNTHKKTLVFGNDPKDVVHKELVNEEPANDLKVKVSQDKKDEHGENGENDDTSLSNDTIEADLKEQRALIEFFGKGSVKQKDEHNKDEYHDDYQDSWKMRGDESDSESFPNHVSVGPSIPAELFNLDEILNNTSEKNILPLKRVSDDFYYKSSDEDESEGGEVHESIAVANPKHTIIEYSFPLKDFSKDEYQDENIDAEGDK